MHCISACTNIRICPNISASGTVGDNTGIANISIQIFFIYFIECVLSAFPTHDVGFALNNVHSNTCNSKINQISRSIEIKPLTFPVLYFKSEQIVAFSEVERDSWHLYPLYPLFPCSDFVSQMWGWFGGGGV